MRRTSVGRGEQRPAYGRVASALPHIPRRFVPTLRTSWSRPHSERVELDRVLLETVGEARHQAGGERVEVGVLQPAVVNGDPDRLKQLLLILLDNALKYTPPPGRVTVELRRLATTVEMTVEHTGVGISPEDLPHVFERFFRADPARSRDPGGTGLGLPIARWIARQHRGDVVLTSQTGRGTTATVDLPFGP